MGKWSIYLYSHLKLGVTEEVIYLLCVADMWHSNNPGCSG